MPRYQLDPEAAYELSRRFVVPFGKHKGRTLADVGSTDEGLSYLGWMVGRRLYPPTRLQLVNFLNGVTARLAA